MAYYTNSGPAQGPYLNRDADRAIDVIRSRDKLMPIGIAKCDGELFDGVAIWRLIVRGVELPGPWVIIDREFRPPQ